MVKRGPAFKIKRLKIQKETFEKYQKALTISNSLKNSLPRPHPITIKNYQTSRSRVKKWRFLNFFNNHNDVTNLSKYKPTNLDEQKRLFFELDTRYNPLFTYVSTYAFS